VVAVPEADRPPPVVAEETPAAVEDRQLVEVEEGHEDRYRKPWAGPLFRPWLTHPFQVYS
jgi:hypothetical protein